jgi:hypothetical protein
MLNIGFDVGQNISFCYFEPSIWQPDNNSVKDNNPSLSNVRAD